MSTRAGRVSTLLSRRGVGAGRSLLAIPAVASAAILGIAALPIVAVLLFGGATQIVLVAVGAGLLGVGALVAYGRLLTTSRSRGYEILGQEHEWDLVRPDGSFVIHRKQLHVRYLNRAISVVDFAWGDGNLFAEYSCRPGRVVDRFIVNDQLWVLISLGGLRQRGEVETLEFKRAITDGFVGQTEWVQLQELEGRVSIRLVFPKERGPEGVEIIRRGRSRFGRITERRTAVAPAQLDSVSERQVLTVKHQRPSRNTSLVVRWKWHPLGVFISHAMPDALVASRLASYLREHGLTVHTTAAGLEDNATRVTARSSVGDATATVLIVGHDSPTDQIRSEWSAALERAWEAEPVPAAVLMAHGAHMPPALRVLPGFQLPSNADEWIYTFDRLRQAMWSPASLVAEGDVKPDRDRNREPVQRAIKQQLRQVAGEPALSRLDSDLEQDRDSFERALASAEQAGDEADIRHTSYALGLALTQLGRPMAAREHLQRAIELTEREFGETHPMVADATYNLALTYANSGDSATAVALLQRAIKVGETVLGPNDPKVRVYRVALANVQSSRAPGADHP